MMTSSIQRTLVLLRGNLFWYRMASRSVRSQVRSRKVVAQTSLFIKQRHQVRSSSSSWCHRIQTSTAKFHFRPIINHLGSDKWHFKQHLESKGRDQWARLTTVLEDRNCDSARTMKVVVLRQLRHSLVIINHGCGWWSSGELSMVSQVTG